MSRIEACRFLKGNNTDGVICRRTMVLPLVQARDFPELTLTDLNTLLCKDPQGEADCFAATDLKIQGRASAYASKATGRT